MSTVRDTLEDDCPFTDYEVGEPAGKCWGDGHYMCTLCKNFRADFKADDTLRDRLCSGQGAMQFITMKPLS